MKLKKFGFLHHYRKIRIEGTNLSGIVNKCIKNGITLKNLRWKDKLESTVEVQEDDFTALKRTAGHSYKLTVIKEGGAVPFFKSMKANITAITGAFLLGALIFYQSLFVAEIRIDGYRSVSEESVRKAVAEAGLYEGVRKPESYDDVKKAIYNEFDEITWVSVYEDGRLIEIELAEASDREEEAAVGTDPVNIVADRSAMIERILPLKGNACVQKGDYVNKGDVLISGEYEYQSSDYSKGDDIFTLYSHAEGQVLARTPIQFTYYLEKNERIKEKTGSFIPGIYIKAGDFELDTASKMNRYEASVKSEKTLLDIVRPLPVKLSLVKISEVSVKESHRDMKKAREVVEAAIRQYKKENLKHGDEILASSIDFSESAGVIKADVLLEVLEDIGKEQAIKVKKEKKNEQRDDS